MMPYCSSECYIESRRGKSLISKIISFLRKIFRREKKVVLNVDSVKIEIIPEKNNTEALDKIISGKATFETKIDVYYIDELLFAPCPLVNCVHYEQCSKNLFKCDWIKEEVMIKDE